MKHCILFFPVLVGILSVGCAVSDFDSAEELDSFTLTSESELTNHAKVNDYSIRVTYRPTDLLVYQELGTTSADSSEVQKLRSKYGGYYYFTLSLTRNSREALVNSGDHSQYNELLSTLAFHMSGFTSLCTSAGDTIHVSDYVLHRTFGLNTSTDLLFVFDRKRIRGQEWVQFDLDEFGLDVGPLQFRFPTRVLDQAPRINFNKIAQGRG